MNQRRLIVFGMLVLTLSGCGGKGATSVAPETVHARWNQALRQGDRAALLTLVDEIPMKDLFVAQELDRVAGKLRDPKRGALKGIDTLPLTADPVGKKGISVWKFEHESECNRTILVEVAGVWKVRAWGLMADCPAGIAQQ